MKLGYAPKTLDIGNGEFLHFWYANNAGRGDSNCTIIRSTAIRSIMSAKQQNVIAKTLTSSWSGNVNFSKRVQNNLGL